MSAKSALKTAGAPPETPVPFALLFQLEDITGSLRRASLEILKDLPGKKAVSPQNFIRLGLSDAPLAQLSAAVESDPAALRDKILAKLELAGAPLPGMVQKLFKLAMERGMTLHALTLLPDAVAEKLAERLGLKELGVHVQGLKDPERDVPAPEVWYKAARGVGRSVRKCGALVTGMAACRNAMAAGLRCIAVPDELTSHQDFSGAILIVEDLSEARPSDILDALFPPTRLGGQ